MKPIDSILKILVQQDGTELRLASDRKPQMFKDGAALPLTIPAMSADRIRSLLDDLWTAHAPAVRQDGEVAFTYASAELGELGRFAVRLVQPDESTLEVRFRREAHPLRTPAAAARPAGSAAVEAGVTASGVAPSGTLPAAVADVVGRALARGASDIHMSPRQAPIVRINGELHALDGAPGFDAASLVGDPERLAHVRAGGSVDRGFDVSGVGRVRVNVYASDDGLCAAVRILNREAPPLADLHLPPQIVPLVDLPHGLVIACGPTGCGKSTTLAALIQHALRARPQVLVTLEDPIEYVIRPPRAPGLVRQREVRTHVRDFATGLRDALREDPDMILVGEMRDADTISLALTAAETGHLVFASLHSRTAPSAVERIIDTYPPERQRQVRVQLADALRAVISQRLVPTADGAGRVPAVELLRVTHGVANLIREGRTAQIVNALQGGGGEGMLLLERSLAELVRAQRIRREDAQAAANDPATLGEYLRSAGAAQP
jgi:twitching motility protein PilT